MTMRMIDLFAGAGGITEGFVRAGFRPVLAVEKDRAAAAAYAVNFGEHVLASDIAELPDASFPRAEVVVGGPPCQGFSALGKRNPDDPRNRLWREFIRVVLLSRPRAFVIENVPQFLKSDQFEMLRSWTVDGPLRDWGLAAGVLNAADYGVSQRRRRAIVIGLRNGLPTLPPATRAQDGKGGLPPWRTVRAALDGIPFETGPASLPDIRLESGVPGPFKVHEMHLSRSPRALVPATLRCGAARRGTV